MDFAIPEALQSRLNTIADIVSDDIIPLEPLMLAGQWSELNGGIAAIRENVKGQGLWAPNLPESIGGTYTDLVDLALIGEVLGQSPLGHICFGTQAPDAGNAELLHLHGTDEQVETYLKPLAAGEVRSCFAMTEPHTAGSNPTLLDATAVRDGSDWVINGQTG